jgi:ribosomal protein S9
MDKAEEIIVRSKAAVKKDYIYALGRRKSSTAEVRLYKKDATVWGATLVKTGEIIVNNKTGRRIFWQKF